MRSVARSCGWIAASFVGVMLAVGSVQAQQQVTAGVDCWETDPNSTIELPPLPGGFFGTKNGQPSQPFPGGTVDVIGLPLPPGVATDPNGCNCQTDSELELVWVDMHGNPVMPGDMHAVGQALVPDPIDTCVRRLSDVPLGAPNTPAPVQVEIVELSLVSVNPIQVDFSPEPPSFYDVFVGLDGAQSQGQMEFIPGASLTTGDVALQGLPVNFQLNFEPVDPNDGVSPVGMGGLNTNFENTNGTFTLSLAVPTLGWTGAVVGGALALLGLAVLTARRRRNATA